MINQVYRNNSHPDHHTTVDIHSQEKGTPRVNDCVKKATGYPGVRHEILAQMGDRPFTEHLERQQKKGEKVNIYFCDAIAS